MFRGMCRKIGVVLMVILGLFGTVYATVATVPVTIIRHDREGSFTLDRQFEVMPLLHTTEPVTFAYGANISIPPGGSITHNFERYDKWHNKYAGMMFLFYGANTPDIRLKPNSTGCELDFTGGMPQVRIDTTKYSSVVMDADMPDILTSNVGILTVSCTGQAK